MQRCRNAFSGSEVLDDPVKVLLNGLLVIHASNPHADSADGEVRHNIDRAIARELRHIDYDIVAAILQRARFHDETSESLRRISSTMGIAPNMRRTSSHNNRIVSGSPSFTNQVAARQC